MNKWGMTIVVLLGILCFFNTCGTKTKITALEKKVVSMEKTININDSLDRELNQVVSEISIYETAREVVYTNNAIVRTAARPDDVMNSYAEKIKTLQAKKEKINNARK